MCKRFFIFLKSLVSFVTLFDLMERDELYASSASFYASIVPASSASVSSTALHEHCSFGLRCTFHNCMAVLFEEVQSLLVVLGVSVVPGREVILQVHLQISMLGAALPH